MWTKTETQTVLPAWESETQTVLPGLVLLWNSSSAYRFSWKQDCRTLSFELSWKAVRVTNRYGKARSWGGAASKRDKVNIPHGSQDLWCGLPEKDIGKRQEMKTFQKGRTYILSPHNMLGKTRLRSTPTCRFSGQILRFSIELRPQRSISTDLVWFWTVPGIDRLSLSGSGITPVELVQWLQPPGVWCSGLFTVWWVNPVVARMHFAASGFGTELDL